MSLTTRRIDGRTGKAMTEKEFMISNSIESIRQIARVYEVNLTKAYKIWIDRGTVSGPKVLEAVIKELPKIQAHWDRRKAHANH